MFNWFKKSTFKQDTATALGIIKRWDERITNLTEQNEQLRKNIAGLATRATSAASHRAEMQRKLDKLEMSVINSFSHEAPCDTFLTYLVANRKIIDACLGKKQTDLEQTKTQVEHLWNDDVADDDFGNEEAERYLKECWRKKHAKPDNTAESKARRDLPKKAESHLFGQGIPTGPINPK